MSMKCGQRGGRLSGAGTNSGERIGRVVVMGACEKRVHG